MRRPVHRSPCACVLASACIGIDKPLVSRQRQPAKVDAAITVRRSNSAPVAQSPVSGVRLALGAIALLSNSDTSVPSGGRCYSSRYNAAGLGLCVSNVAEGRPPSHLVTAPSTEIRPSLAGSRRVSGQLRSLVAAGHVYHGRDPTRGIHQRY